MIRTNDLCDRIDGWYARLIYLLLRWRGVVR